MGSKLETKILHARIARQSPSSFLGICLALALLAAVRNSVEFCVGVDFCSGRHVSRSIAQGGSRFRQRLGQTNRYLWRLRMHHFLASHQPRVSPSGLAHNLPAPTLLRLTFPPPQFPHPV